MMAPSETHQTVHTLWKLSRCAHLCSIFIHQPRTTKKATVHNWAKLRCFLKSPGWKYPWRLDWDVRENTQTLRTISYSLVPNFNVCLYSRHLSSSYRSRPMWSCYGNKDTVLIILNVTDRCQRLRENTHTRARAPLDKESMTNTCD